MCYDAGEGGCMPNDGIEGDRMLVQVRLPRDLVKRIDHLCVDWDLYRVELIEQLLQEGLKTWDGPPASKS